MFVDLCFFFYEFCSGDYGVLHSSTRRLSSLGPLPGRWLPSTVSGPSGSISPGGRGKSQAVESEERGAGWSWGGVVLLRLWVWFAWATGRCELEPGVF